MEIKKWTYENLSNLIKEFKASDKETLWLDVLNHTEMEIKRVCEWSGAYGLNTKYLPKENLVIIYTDEYEKDINTHVKVVKCLSGPHRPGPYKYTPGESFKPTPPTSGSNACGPRRNCSSCGFQSVCDKAKNIENYRICTDCTNYIRDDIIDTYWDWQKVTNKMNEEQLNFFIDLGYKFLEDLKNKTMQALTCCPRCGSSKEVHEVQDIISEKIYKVKCSKCGCVWHRNENAKRIKYI